MTGAALAQELQPRVDDYYINIDQINDMNNNKSYLETSIAELNNSLIQSKERLKKVTDDINLFSSEIDAINKAIQENNNNKNEIERNINLINILNTKESITVIGTFIGMIFGLWISSLVLVILWGK
jgi:septal ring factor EnvC (AmiA/AmiB activator)